MELLKKFAKEISVFGVVLVIFLALLGYRTLTFKDYKTIDSTKLTQMVEAKDDFVLVVGDSTASDVVSFQDVMAEYTTANRDVPLYYVDTNGVEDFDSYLDETLKTSVTYPATLIIKDGEVTAKKQGALTYYYFKDFVDGNFK